MQQPQMKCNGCHKCIKGVRGAGVLMIDHARGQIILVKDQRATYNDAGGILDRSKHPTVAHCASQELCEETRGTVRANLNGCPYIDVSCGKHHWYRIYILYVNGPGQLVASCGKFYKTNPKTLPKEYRETTRMTRFPIAPFRSERQGHGNGKGRISSTKRTDSGGNETVHERVLKGIAVAIDRGYM